MPNERDNAPFQWPQGTDEAWLPGLHDGRMCFPMGPDFLYIPPRVLQNQIKECLDKVVTNQTKAVRK